MEDIVNKTAPSAGGTVLINQALAWKKILIECGIEEKEIESFSTELNLSQQLSIDAFLEHRSEYLRIGKLTIALALMEFEDDTVLPVNLGTTSISLPFS